MTTECKAYKSEVSAALEICEGIRNQVDADYEAIVSEESLVETTISAQSQGLLQRQPKEVFLRYGPYESCGIVDHRTHRLHGIQEQLRRAGHVVHLVPVIEWNVVELWVHGEHIFSCDIRDLDFGGDGLIDGLCLQAVSRVENAL